VGGPKAVSIGAFGQANSTFWGELIMNRAFGVIATAASLIAAPAFAADMPIKALPPVPPPAWTWTGFYLGLNAGWGWDAKVDNLLITTDPALGGYPATAAGTNPTGPFAGVDVGYNWQVANFLVFGFEADFEGSNIQNGFQNRVIDVFGDQLSAEQALNAFSTIRGRLGLAYNNFLVYGTGGLAYGDVHNRVVDVLTVPPTGTVNISQDAWQSGYAVGGGVEYMVAPHASLKVEYQYIKLGSFTGSALESPPSGFTFSTNSINNNFQTVRVGLNVHL
jgi:outer membrane immunogenic protein